MKWILVATLSLLLVQPEQLSADPRLDEKAVEALG